MGMTLRFRHRARPSTSLVADPRDPGGQITEVQARPDATTRHRRKRLGGAWKAALATRLHSRFSARDQIEKGQSI